MTAHSALSSLWYLTRGTGTVALVLLTLTVALGVANVRRLRTGTVPRFVLADVHRNISLLAIAFVTIHVITAVLDPYAPIRLLDAFVPLASAYRPVWLGLGAVALDLMLALAVTSMLRRRFGHRVWRSTHWLAYASWPVAVVHGLGTGSDAKTHWLLLITGLCGLIVIGAVWVRATAGWPRNAGLKAGALVTSLAVPAALLVWLPSGPLSAGWAKRAGTPSPLLARANSTPPAFNATPTGFNATLSGSISQVRLRDGMTMVDLTFAVARQPLDSFRVRIIGRPLPGGGVEMTSSTVTLGTHANPSLLAGKLTGLDDSQLAAQVSGSAGRFAVAVRLDLDPQTGRAGGVLSAEPV